MARIPLVTRDRVREDLRSIFDEVSSGPGGVGTGPMSILKYSPEMARRAIPLFNYVRNESSLPQKVRELARLSGNLPPSGLKGITRSLKAQDLDIRPFPKNCIH